MENVSLFTKRIIKDRFKDNYSLYKKAGFITNIPPFVLAAIHFRENSMLPETDSPSGPMQYDPPLKPERMEKLLKTYTNLDEEIIKEYVLKGQMDLETSLILCGCFVQEKMLLNNCTNLTKEMNTELNKDLLMKAFLFYNGKKYGGPMDSPYVVNLLDEDHMYMHLYGSVIDGDGNRKKVDIKDTRPGAFVIMKFLESCFKVNY